MGKAMWFAEEYERIRIEVYRGRLPDFPGIRTTRGRITLAATNWGWWTGEAELLPFSLSTHAKSEALVRELARHETAHVAAMLFEGEHEHGALWRKHAKRCGANPHEIVLPWQHP